MAAARSGASEVGYGRRPIDRRRPPPAPATPPNNTILLLSYYFINTRNFFAYCVVCKFYFIFEELKLIHIHAALVVQAVFIDVSILMT
ncbi:unnamed protein product [Chrysodeixis includens]|uniref:Uncharacterized protein n=1 Tax=Chrysodeixis includens TaxID=689277 RepID=A0A9N8Q1C3_CHRIL|nr:unnamed protein product [Chrysodeixis includens]